MKMMKILLAAVIIFFTYSEIYAGPKITVAVAANVQYAMEELKAEFKKETGIDVTVIIGSSGQLTAQIKEGAPYDIFISADMKYPEVLFKEKAAIDSPRVYAMGSLVVWTTGKGITFDKKLNALLSKKISKIAIANPRTAPYGSAAVEALKHFGIYGKVKNKLVYGESIAQVNQFTYGSAVDAGFTAKSVVLSPQMKGKGSWMVIDPGSYKSIEQGCVILKYGFDNHRAESKKFFDFLFSQKAKNILLKYGYILK